MSQAQKRKNEKITDFLVWGIVVKKMQTLHTAKQLKKKKKKVIRQLATIRSDRITIFVSTPAQRASVKP